MSAGELAVAELGFDPVAAISTGVHATLARCLHTLNVIRTISMFHEGTIPRKVANRARPSYSAFSSPSLIAANRSTNGGSQVDVPLE